MKEEVINAIIKNAALFGYEQAALKAFVDVESSGQGFDLRTGKIMIQFEPAWFRKKAPYAPTGMWSVNKVEKQAKEWIAFNDAFAINPNAAMESTSIGLGQIMGFNYKMLGYNSVGEMWDDAKSGLDKQVYQMCKYIEALPKLQKALKEKNWHLVATYYNGAGYKDMAKKTGRVPYDIAMCQAYKKYSE
ncbi:hypothetical protein M2132_001075 [Dysgonomonas sp. PH5-45]|uniref:N-acetylmuramidase domain-containing protein n=1 Tax=unclassified Dysgonomonas TaxID=2630389 RepID=UPI002475D68B|nr:MULTISPECIES: N-acetylmuramidase domain-containing protein [unclassified Dysgonomonas]MDH6354746.1 hypothetical protein [Dysgonomonas sp. PH5-45]MDH6387645.1 hypothetical protein [Dysgonomonas sp. PH5-37]